MKKRRIVLPLCLILCALLMFSCQKAEEGSETEETREKNWRDSIEYEGSFYVSDGIKYLYAVKKGKITLWDDSKDGNVKQELSYDSTAEDVADRLERLDENGDGYTDLRLIYDEGENCVRYNLWVWDIKNSRYSLCSNYKNIENPEKGTEPGTIIGTFYSEDFGTLKKTFTFNSTCGIDQTSSEILERDALAEKIGAGLGLDTLRLSDNTVTVDKLKCTLYIASGDGSDTAYLVCSDESKWYADVGCTGEYRAVNGDGEGNYSLSERAAENS